MKNTKRNNRKNGFTLIEIMIVVAIIGILAAIAIPGFKNARAKSADSAKTANARILISAYEAWADDNPNAVTADSTTGLEEYWRGGVEAFEVGGTPAVIPTTVGAFETVSLDVLKGVMYP